jgi:hypothetical protein
MRDILFEIYLWIRVTFNPKYWLSNYSISKEWDIQVRAAISHGAIIKRVDQYRISIGCLQGVWGASYPCAYCEDPIKNGVPTRRTRLLVRMLEDNSESENAQKKRREDVFDKIMGRQNETR